MARSMTGFGHATGEYDGETHTVEVSSVNHRFLDCSFRLPYAWTALEAPLKERIKKDVARGKLNICIRRDRSSGKRQAIRCDQELAKQYIDAAKRLADIMHTTEVLTLDALVKLDGVLCPEESDTNTEVLTAAVGATLDAAIAQLNEARAIEGQALTADLNERIAAMRDALATVEQLAPDLSAAYETRLRERITALNAEVGLAEERIAMEVAIMAEKADVNEEIVRLKAHFEHVDEMVAGSEPPVTLLVGEPSSLPNHTPVVRLAV